MLLPTAITIAVLLLLLLLLRLLQFGGVSRQIRHHDVPAVCLFPHS
jgi:hypothetical protein